VKPASAQQARAARRSIVFTGVVGGAAMVPVGLALWQRSDAVSQSVGAGLTIGGSAPLLFSALSLFPSTIDRLDASYERQHAATVPHCHGPLRGESRVLHLDTHDVVGIPRPLRPRGRSARAGGGGHPGGSG
jgi:hypothetical protein